MKFIIGLAFLTSSVITTQLSATTKPVTPEGHFSAQLDPLGWEVVELLPGKDGQSRILLKADVDLNYFGGLPTGGDITEQLNDDGSISLKAYGYYTQDFGFGGGLVKTDIRLSEVVEFDPAQTEAIYLEYANGKKVNLLDLMPVD